MFFLDENSKKIIKANSRPWSVSEMANLSEDDGEPEDESDGEKGQTVADSELAEKKAVGEKLTNNKIK